MLYFASSGAVVSAMPWEGSPHTYTYCQHAANNLFYTQNGNDKTFTVSIDYNVEGVDSSNDCYIITASAGNNGSISPNGAQSVSPNGNGSKTFTFTPNSGYQIDQVKVDNVVTAVSGNTYTFSNVTNHHTIYVTFKQSTSPPANDNCSNATSLYCGATVSGTLVGATPSTIYGNYTTFGDVFYQFTAANSGNHTITFTKSKSSDDIDVIVYQGCSSTTEVASISANGITETATFNCTAGTNYRIRVVSSNSNGSEGFSIKVDCPSAAFLTVSPVSYNFESGGGTSSAILVNSNVSWTISDNASWLTTSKTSGSNNSTFTMTATANASTSSRGAKISVTGGGITSELSITQAGVSAQPSLQLLSLAANGTLYQNQTGNFTATLKNNGNAAYNSYLYVYMEKRDIYTPNQRISAGVISIAAGETKTIMVSGTINLPPGTYSCNMIQDINNNPSDMALQQFDGTVLGVQVIVQVSPPDNDQCANAINLVSGTAVSGSLAGATPTNIYDDGTLDDVFYKFTTSKKGICTITLTKSDSSYDIDLHLFSSCGSTTMLTGINNNSIIESVSYTCEAETTYYIRVLDVNNTNGEFSIKVDYNQMSMDYSPYRESKHFIFDIPDSYLIGNITPENLGRWMRHMDDVYDAYSNLLGGHTPCNGQKLTIVASDAGYGWLWVYPNNPYIYWNDGLVASDMKQINDDDVWFWGSLHEIGHLFDKDPEPNWMFHGEITANLKAIYAIAVIPDCHLEMNGIMRYSLQDIYNYFYDYSVLDDGEDDRYSDKITLGFIKIAQRYGWNVFTKTFNSYWDNSYPNAGCNVGSAGKYNEFIDRLEYFSGSANIRNECFSTNNWLATIEQHYPNNSIATWQIGSPNTADVTASFNCNTGVLTIDGTGDMRDWIYFNNESGNIISVIVNNGVTNIGCGAFEACGNLTSVTIPSSITSIRSYAFKDTKALTSLIIPNSVTNIGDDETFKGSGLTSIVIPNLVTSICEEAFLDCKNLASVTIPEHVKSIGERAFSDCSSLVEIHSKNPIPPSISYASFAGVNKNSCKLYVPEASLSAYKTANGWKEFFNINATAIEDISTNQISIFPNPTKDEIFIKSDLPIRMIEICDLSGRSVKTENNPSFYNGVKTINISSLTQEIYLIKIHTDSGMIIKKIVKK